MHCPSRRRSGGPRSTRRHRLTGRTRTVVRILPPQQTRLVCRPIRPARSSQRLQVWTCNLLLSMLSGVADPPPAILFILDPSRRLLRRSAHGTGICSSSGSCRRGQVNRRAMTTQRAWTASHSHWFELYRTNSSPSRFPLLPADARWNLSRHALIGPAVPHRVWLARVVGRWWPAADPPSTGP
jgi:hypothetical protein